LKAALVDGFCAFLAATAVMFKQMSLYFAPAIAVVLLFRCLGLCQEINSNGESNNNSGDTTTENNTNNKKQQSKKQPLTQATSPSPSPFSSRVFLHVSFRMLFTLCCGLFGFAAPFVLLNNWYPLNPFDVITRMFPFSRGLYEDKVANFWCSISVVFKLHHFVQNREWIVRICAGTTILSFLPACKIFFTRSLLERRVTPQRIATLLTVSALCFFLFSFQVHEKSILMAVTSTIGIWIHSDSRQRRSVTTRLACAHFMLVAMVSLQPLCVKDKLDGAVWCSLALIGCLIVSLDAMRNFSYVELLIAHDNVQQQQQQQDSTGDNKSSPALENNNNTTKSKQQSPLLPLLTKPDESESIRLARRKRYLYSLSLISLLWVSVVAPLIIEPSEALPDILPMLNSIVCCAHFVWYAVFWTQQLGEPF
jgi:hypothetical protein